MSEKELGRVLTFTEQMQVQFPLAFKMLEMGDVYGEPREGHEDIWLNVSKHCLTQAAASDVLSDALLLPLESRLNLTEAGLMHDWDKKYQMMGLKRVDLDVSKGWLTEKQAGRLKYILFDQSEAHSAEGMRENRVSEEIIKICAADGHPFFPRFKWERPSFEEKIFHYLGSITDGNNIVPLNQRIDNLETKDAYKMMNQYGKTLLWTNGKTLYEMQREVGHEIEKEIVDALLVSGSLNPDWYKRLNEKPLDLPIFINELVEQKYPHI